MRLHTGLRVFPVVGGLLLFIVCVHGRRKYPQKVHEMVQEKLARRWGSAAGQWSGWSGWSACSLSCGGGVATQTRHCLSRPGKLKRHSRQRLKTRLPNSQCVGVYKRFHMCSEQPCPEPAADLRAEQCSSHDAQPYMGKRYRWRPHYSKSRPCALTCQPLGYAFYVTLSHAVKDGTRCAPDGQQDLPDHVCAAGMCQRVGCDGVLGSGRVLDACGECGGDNSTCQIISGLFTEPYMKAGYRQVVQIPAGACSIRIEEMAATNNYLALSDSKGEFIINGDWNIDLSGTYSGAGTRFKYQRQHQKRKGGERISAKGPTSEPVDIFILYRQANRGIKYEYAIKRNSSLTNVLPRLLTGSAAGEVPSMAEPSLRRPAGQPPPPPPRDAPVLPPRGNFVSPLYQSSPAGSSAPFPVADGSGQTAKRRRRRRRRRRSRFQWVVTGFTECSRTCGGGTKTTEVVCMKRKRKQLAPDRNCKEANRPEPTTITCNTQSCPARWEPDSWSTCSVSCGSGHQLREQRCVRDDQQVAAGECADPRPGSDRRICQQPPCPPGLWQIGAWSQCSVTCGWGQRRRQVTCQPAEGRCSSENRPRDTRSCRRADCESGPSPAGGAGPQTQQEAQPQTDSWMTSEWSQQCSADCGEGVQWRQVTCVGGVSSCDGRSRPEETRPCKTDRHCAGIWLSGPWSRCSHLCGAGVQTRAVVCVRMSAGQPQVTSDTACVAPRPDGQRVCSGGDCPARWHGADWTACSASCGEGWQSRAVACLTTDGEESGACPSAERMSRRRACSSVDCQRRALFDWGATNETEPQGDDESEPPARDGGNPSLPPPPADGSGGPEPFRAVPAETHDVTNSITAESPSVTDNRLDSSAQRPLTAAPAVRRSRPRKHRKHNQRPAGDQRATERSNSLANGSCADRFDNCLLVQQARLCKYKYYKTHCCATCAAS